MPVVLQDLGPLESLTDLLVAPAGATAATTQGRPLYLPISDIDEDPDQPRTEFDLASLDELAQTIRQRGVLQPISVRTHPHAAGRWMLNFGARRLRASQLAGQTEIAAYADLAPDSYDQVIENEQRDALSPLDLALFIGRRLDAGECQAEVARRLGKSRPYVLYGTALLNAPDWLLHLYRQGVCRGLRELHELRRLAEVQPGPVTLWANQQSSIGRTDIHALRRELRAEPEIPEVTSEKTVANSAAASEQAQAATSSARTTAASGALSESRRLLARLAGATVAVLADSANVPDGMVAVRHLVTGARQLVRPESLTLMGVFAEPKCVDAANVDAAEFNAAR